MRRAVCAVIAGSLLTAATAGHDWAHYRFGRFGTGLDVPTDVFTSRTEPDNGDGATFAATDGARLLVFGSWNVDERTPRSQVQWLKETDAERYRDLSYEKTVRSFAVLSGRRGTEIFYERYRFDDPSGAVHAVVLEYPVSKRALYDPMITRISSSLDWSKPL